MKHGPQLSGFLNLNKPAGFTSHDCVAKLRRMFRLKRVGHGGTLDPMATGVLPIALGTATRLLPYLPTEKAYRGVIQLGLVTDTDDITGTIIAQANASEITQAQVRQGLEIFHKGYDQRPPAYSAVQVAGKRLYQLARKGESIDISTRWVDIFNLEVLAWQPGPTATVELMINCGPGTYIRSIARDLGAVLGVGATLASLTRTKSCGFELGNSCTLDDLNPDSTNLIAPGLALQHLPAIRLDAEIAKRWCCGQKMAIETVNLTTPHRVLDQAGTLLGIGQLEDDIFRAKVVLPSQIDHSIDNNASNSHTSHDSSANDFSG
ncbi:tRNA pseudouridine(55) synthase TruB [Thermosynechococcaceae cyanobacterium BACA0444]|uniref:tRNA pseudouridine synthase B n=1 Tax=Pseudocalidococcus azoricus BACA0444 TaxID=2918990 RepID=A0AAE4JVN6_9CYAN|nr:tRNA pseudouridine(55) synthase TruB [Pseudocalidococcus azoricus]MDS3860520.1 tRNA pseudouridine(55) synthase TruB [Pseudocalidococcus azoricus BACA0444]